LHRLLKVIESGERRVLLPPSAAEHAFMPERPTSPHLSVYKMFRYTLFTSFFNRATGVVLSVGLLVLVYWLMAVASGARTYARASTVLSLGIFKLVFAGLLIAFSYHLVAGIRHLIWDTGRGLERQQAKRSAWLVAGASIVLMIVFGYCVFLSGAHAS
jgi:succinate dehydrogenase / fumarate reductase cytochrome b subunit